MLEKDIQEIIESKLTGIAGRTMQKYIEEAEEVKKKLVIADQTVVDQCERIQSLKLVVDEYLSKDRETKEREAQVADREKAVGDCEVKLELMKKDADCASEKVGHMYSVLSLVFRNTIVKKNVLSDKSHVVGSGDGFDTIQQSGVQDSESTEETLE